PGRAYVYRSYGIHALLNAVCEPEGIGAAVLIRALEPTDGVAVMATRRGTQDLRKLCAGPGRVCQALGVTRETHNGRPPFELLAPAREYPIANGVRIGLTKGVDTPWRFGLKGSVFLSRPF
ncbi:MAG: DNA-3-methyladenine glycosylase, partial [Hyphomicrobiales bacterium]|nr:DNA-3-methyladenine glycosylase [Hyphomicrobiales bacterium]